MTKVLLSFLIFGFISTGAFAGQTTFKLVSELVGKSKLWLPSTLVVKKGEKVKILAQSNIPGKNPHHGLSIPAFGIKEEIGNNVKTIRFTADKAGIHEINCHMHPAHIGAQLIVLE